MAKFAPEVLKKRLYYTHCNSVTQQLSHWNDFRTEELNIKPFPSRHPRCREVIPSKEYKSAKQISVSLEQMAEDLVSEAFANSVKRNLNEVKDPTSVSSQLNLLGYNLNTAFTALNTIRGSFDGAFFDSLSQQEKSNLQKSLSEIDDCVHVLQQQLLANLQNSIELTSHNDAGHCSLTDDGHPDVMFSSSPRTHSSSIDVIIGRPIDDSESDTFNGKHLAGTVIAPVPVANNAYERSNNGCLVEAGRGTEAPHKGNGKSSVRRLSQQAGSLFSRSGSAIHPKPATITFSNLSNENSQQRPKTSELSVQPPEKGVEVSATEGWIKVSPDRCVKFNRKVTNKNSDIFIYALILFLSGASVNHGCL